MRLPRRTPYLGSPAAELKAVHALLYARDPIERRAGLERTALWLNRSACPYAVENTAALVEAQLAEERESQSRSESMASRLSLNMAIVRFVNSLVDSYQTGMFAAPVKTIAMRVGLPLWLVELRHAGTHDELPSLESLRLAGDIALQWLDTKFWTPSIAEAEKAFGAESLSPSTELADIEEDVTQQSESTGFESTLDTMRRRIAEAESLKRAAEQGRTLTSAPTSSSQATAAPLPHGWRIAGPDWKPTPIGLLRGTIPDLDL
ncbi:rRNA-processing protein las1 [Tilletia horrida]|nr:rRNA-processing protein las1 [Tilletia horrida]